MNRLLCIIGLLLSYSLVSATEAPSIGVTYEEGNLSGSHYGQEYSYDDLVNWNLQRTGITNQGSLRTSSIMIDFKAPVTNVLELNIGVGHNRFVLKSGESLTVMDQYNLSGDVVKIGMRYYFK